MKPSELINLIKVRFNAVMRRPLLLEAGPGVGKTQVAAQAAQALGVGFMAIHAPLLQPEDYGLPCFTADRNNVNFIVSSDKFPLEGSDCPERGIFLIDEISQCGANEQKILTNLIHEREIHGKRLKPGWYIIATGNRTTDRAGANRILSHLGGRVTRLAFDVSLDDWSNWALDNGVKAEVVAFIRFRPELLNAFDANVDVSPTPRAWVDGVSAGLGVVDNSSEFETFKGDVGEAAAVEFLSFLKIYRKLPSVDAILLAPATHAIPGEKEVAVTYALCGALAHRASADNFGRIMQYISRMSGEFGVLFVRDALRLCPTISTSKDFIQWAAKDGAKLLS